MCEDYPCCGHENGDCNVREDSAARDLYYERQAMRDLDNDYYFD